MYYRILILASISLLLAPGKAPATERKVGLKLDSLEFTAPTSLKAMTVHGKAEKIDGQAVYEGDRLVRVETTVAVDALSTGMSLRDRHMREKIFQLPDGSTPALAFKSSEIACEGSRCAVKGDLSLQGKAKPTTFSCRLDPKGSPAGAADCSADVKLSDYGIARPSQLGVTVEDAVNVKLRVKGQ